LLIVFQSCGLSVDELAIQLDRLVERPAFSSLSASALTLIGLIFATPIPI
jgi:hypothetical protein